MADDDESLDEILSTPAKAETPAPEVEPEAQPEATPRDEHGRFAPKAEAEPEAETPEEQPEAGHEDDDKVGAIVANRKRAQQAERERDDLGRKLAELQGQMSVLMQRGTQPAEPQKAAEPPKPLDFWESPDKFVEHALGPVQEQLAEATFRASRAEALSEHGKEAVAAAQEAMKQAVVAGTLNGEAVKASLLKSRDPVGDIVRWHQNSPAVKEASLRETLRAELMAELGIDPNAPKPAAQSSQPSTRNPVVKLPPSLSKVPAGHAAPDRDESLDEVLSRPRRSA